MSTEERRFRILDLFCGAGGLSYGMHKNPDFITKERRADYIERMG